MVNSHLCGLKTILSAISIPSAIPRSSGKIRAEPAGSALILPEERGMAEGIEMADSIVFNPHKWLLTNFDCSAHYVKRPESLIRTLSILPEYLKSREQDQVIDYRDWSSSLDNQ